ncbi:MAG: hypothetical protein R6T96_15825 [Longimicrobiales bacterium]
MATLGSRRGFADKLSLPLMLLAFVLVGGFLYWLNLTAEPTEVEIVEETADEGPSASAILDVEDFLGNPEGQIDAVVEVTNARVASRLGAQAFWIGPDDAPYLVKMSPEVVQEGIAVPVESTVNITGTVYMMSDSVLNAWDSLGVFGNPGDRIVAEFATSFLEALDIEMQTPGSQSDGG